MNTRLTRVRLGPWRWSRRWPRRRCGRRAAPDPNESSRSKSLPTEWGARVEGIRGREASGGASVRVDRASCAASLATRRGRGVPVILTSAQKRPLPFAPAFVRILAETGASVVRVADADRLGRESAPGVASLLDALGVRVELDLPSSVGARHGRAGGLAAKSLQLDGCVVVPAGLLGPGGPTGPWLPGGRALVHRDAARALGLAADGELVGSRSRPLCVAVYEHCLRSGGVAQLRAER